MKHLLYLLFFLPLLIGCGSSGNTTEPVQTGKLGPLTIEKKSTPVLEGGGRIFHDADTATWYDASFPFTITNTSGDLHVLHYSFGVGYLENDKFVGQITGFLKNREITETTVLTDTIDNPVPANQTVTLAIPTTFYFTPINNNRAFAYRLEIFDEANNSVVFTGLFGNTGPENRFHGILFTTEQSPDVQGVLDSADDGDWQAFPNSLGEVHACSPNPTTGIVTFSFQIIGETDSLNISLNVTPKGALMNIPLKGLSSGYHSMAANLASFERGTVRSYLHLFHDGQEYISRGDIMITK